MERYHTHIHTLSLYSWYKYMHETHTHTAILHGWCKISHSVHPGVLGLVFVSLSLLLSLLLFLSVIFCPLSFSQSHHVLLFFVFSHLSCSLGSLFPPTFLILTTFSSSLSPSILFWDIDRGVMLARVCVFVWAGIPPECCFYRTAAPLETLSLTNCHTMITCCV